MDSFSWEAQGVWPGSPPPFTFGFHDAGGYLPKYENERRKHPENGEPFRKK